MTYIALYRKWRSQNYDQVIGQEPIIQTLRNAVKSGRLAHAYLFSGPRGTGKTSVARILAKSLNCVNGPTADPCGKCDRCTKIRDGQAVDVIEIDAASNRGIDEIRDLREKVRYAPVEGKYKIYIIDEVHMLTSEAFNALLKTLEEPPSHTVFVLATTEAQKVPATISSRCQRLDFRRIPLSLIVEHLKGVAKTEGFSIDDSALSLIARTSEGSMRDAISLLDQLVSFCGGKITKDDVITVLGTADEEFLFSMLESISDGNAARAISLVEKAVSEGRSIPQITRDIVGHIRYLLLCKFGSDSVIDLIREYLDRLKADSAKLSVERLKSLISIFSKAELDMRWHPHGRLILEVAVMEAITNIQVKDVREVKELVKDAKDVRDVKGVRELVKEVKGVGGKEEHKTVEIKIAEPTSEKPDLLFKVKENWDKALQAVKKKSLFGYVSLHEGSPVKIDASGSLVIGFKKGFSFHKERLEDAANREAVESSLEEVLGQKVRIECIVSDDIPQAPQKSSKDAKSLNLESVKNMFSGKIMRS
jgi:DNA polymerase-3 subunit gamma/tau